MPRPKSPKTLSPAERKANSRQTLLARGGKRFDVDLRPADAARLDEIKRRRGVTSDAEMVRLLVREGG